MLAMLFGVPGTGTEYLEPARRPRGMPETGIPAFVTAYGLIVAFLLISALLG
jgi:hypothetical protein